MGLSVTVLGCDGGYPGPGGATSGYLVQAGGLKVLMDAGHGCLANLQAHLDPAELDAVILSHEHPDHWGDLEGLAVMRMGLGGATALPVYAPVGLRSHVYHDRPGLFDWSVVADGDAVELGELKMSFSRTDHGPETLAVRLDADGSSLGFTADTGPDWSISALGLGLDLALCEATWLAGEEGGAARHLSARQAGAMAAEAGAKRCVLTHRRPTVAGGASFAEGSEAYGSAVEQASVGAVFVL
ncbi:MAG: MBL fold metallo-hydrolase [Acidimicrobiales bacterium]